MKNFEFNFILWQYVIIKVLFRFKLNLFNLYGDCSGKASTLEQRNVKGCFYTQVLFLPNFRRS